MPEELENTQETPEPNEAPTEDELFVIKGQLREEQNALAEAQAALIEKDDRISELQAEGEALRAERGNLEEAHVSAVRKYLEAQRSLHPDVPTDLIDGATIEEIDASVEKAQGITDYVRASLAAESQNARVPAGAPSRAVNIDGLDTREKITLGLAQQKGGNS